MEVEFSFSDRHLERLLNVIVFTEGDTQMDTPIEKPVWELPETWAPGKRFTVINSVEVNGADFTVGMVGHVMSFCLDGFTYIKIVSPEPHTWKFKRSELELLYKTLDMTTPITNVSYMDSGLKSLMQSAPSSDLCKGFARAFFKKAPPVPPPTTTEEWFAWVNSLPVECVSGAPVTPTPVLHVDLAQTRVTPTRTPSRYTLTVTATGRQEGRVSATIQLRSEAEIEIPEHVIAEAVREDDPDIITAWINEDDSGDIHDDLVSNEEEVDSSVDWGDFESDDDTPGIGSPEWNSRDVGRLMDAYRAANPEPEEEEEEPETINED